jgi:hypothetical protein
MAAFMIGSLLGAASGDPALGENHDPAPILALHEHSVIANSYNRDAKKLERDQAAGSYLTKFTI